ncbi:MFS transporter [Brevibacillus nitrificans]|uniref:MFS transporter n=1 Tax=Brevibacillus nitrificans TaxID=651560 RepID=A0A3M8CT65_9BACL|nr:MFS transporter [Brevibacillus nitrificans]RNB78719.1 MFS transporter [Brevibacillus nitrificans]
MSYIRVGSPEYRRIFISMLLGSTVTFAILYGPQTLIHTFSESFGISPSTASFTVSFPTFTLAVSMLFVAVFSNAWGRKKIMGISLLSASVLNILSAFSPGFQTLIVLRVLQGFAMAGFPAIAVTYLSEEISPSHLGRIVGIYVGGSAIGAFIGRVIVSTLTDFFSWNVALLALGVINLVCSLFFFICLPESKNFKSTRFSFANWATGITNGLKEKRLLLLYIIGFVMLGAYVALFNYIGFLLSKPPYLLSQTLIGLLFICQLAGSWSSYSFGQLTEKFSRTRLLFLAIAMFLAGALMTLSSHILVLILGLILFASGFLASHSIASGWVGILSPPPLKAYSSSLYLLFYYTGSSVIGWSGGLFFSSYGWNGVIFLVCALTVITVLLILALHRTLRSAKLASTGKPEQITPVSNP